MWNTRHLLVLFLSLYSLSCVLGRDTVDIQAEINRIQKTITKLKPPPEVMEHMLDQLQAHCNKDTTTTLDPKAIERVRTCMDQYVNETQLTQDIKDAVPQGRLDNVFRDICLKWPKVRSCLDPFFTTIEQCWDKGEKITQIVNKSVEFLCGEDNDGGRIALFLAEGGFVCLEEHGDKAKMCVANINEIQMEFDEENPQVDLSKITLPETEQICRTMQQMADCATKELRKCNDPTPENIITSMLRYSSSTIGCQLQESPVARVASTSSHHFHISFAGWLLSLMGAIMFLV